MFPTRDDLDKLYFASSALLVVEKGRDQLIADHKLQQDEYERNLIEYNDKVAYLTDRYNELYQSIFGHLPQKENPNEA